MVQNMFASSSGQLGKRLNAWVSSTLLYFFSIIYAAAVLINFFGCVWYWVARREGLTNSWLTSIGEIDPPVPPPRLPPARPPPAPSLCVWSSVCLYLSLCLSLLLLSVCSLPLKLSVPFSLSPVCLPLYLSVPLFVCNSFYLLLSQSSLSVCVFVCLFLSICPRHLHSVSNNRIHTIPISCKI